MAALDFPASPTNGQVFVGGNGVTYTYNGTIWLASSMASQASDTPPANPQTNQLWFNSALGQLFIYYNDGSSSQWVPTNPSASVGQILWRQLGRNVPIAGQQFIDFINIPTDINNLQCFLGDVLPATNDAGIGMQFFDVAGAVVASSSYQTSNVLTTAAMPAGTQSPGQGAMTANLVIFNYQGVGNGVANNAAYGFSASVNIYNIRDTTRTKKTTFSCNYLNGVVTTENTTIGGGHLPIAGAITGLRFQFFPGTFAAGGVATLWGAP